MSEGSRGNKDRAGASAGGRGELPEPSSCATYEIVTVDDFLKVPEDRLAACLEEFVTALAAVRCLREVVLADGAPADNAVVVGKFTWKDDGRRTARFNFNVVTGGRR